jgi:hypothetical protein
MVATTHPRKLILLAMLSLADLILTWFLLERGGGSAYERNPIAAWWLAEFGWVGLAGFKLMTLLVFAAVVLVLARRRPRVAAKVLAFGCYALLAVVLYSAVLLPRAHAEGSYVRAQLQKDAQLEKQLVSLRAYEDLLDQLADKLAAHRITLPEAIESLSTTEQVHDAVWQRSMALCAPGCTHEQILGARLIRQVVRLQAKDPTVAARLARELDAEFRSHFGSPTPAYAMPRSPSEDYGYDYLPAS